MTPFNSLNRISSTPDSLLRSALIVAVIAALLLLIPLTAMLISSEAKWSLFDFIAAWTLLFGAGFSYKLAVRMLGGRSYRLAVGTAVGTGLFLIWSNLAVGIIGSENNPANLMYFGVLAVGIIGVVIVRFQPERMEYVMAATAVAQMLVALIVLLAGPRLTQNSPVTEILAVNGFFAALWALSALFFRYARSRQTEDSGK